MVTSSYRLGMYKKNIYASNYVNHYILFDKHALKVMFAYSKKLSMCIVMTAKCITYCIIIYIKFISMIAKKVLSFDFYSVSSFYDIVNEL